MKSQIIRLKPNTLLSINERKKYAIWRNINFVCMILAYSAFYIVKYSFKKVYGDGAIISTSEYATIAMLFNISYGLSKFTTGQFADRVNSRYILCSGLLLTSIFNLISGAYHNIIFISIMLMIVAWFQGFGWPPIAKMFSIWFVKKERGLRLGIWSISHNIGGALAPFLIIPVAFIPMESLGKMFIPSFIGIVFAIISFFLIKENPKKLDLPRVEKYLNVQIEDIDIKDAGEINSWRNNVKSVLKNKWIWIFLIAYTAAMVFRLAPGDFMFKYIDKYHGLGKKGDSGAIGNIAFMLFEFIGIPSSIFVGWFSDFMVRKNKGRYSIMTFAFIMSIVGLSIMWLAPKGNVALIITGIVITSWFVWMIIAMGAPIIMDLAPKRILATAIGFKGLMGYVVASILGDLVAGILVDRVGWNAFFIFILCVGVIGTLCFSFLWMFKKETNESGKFEEVTNREINKSK